TWIAHKFYIPLETAKKNPEWPKAISLIGVKLTGNEKKENIRTLNSNSSEGDVEYAELYEVWDKTNKKVHIISKSKGVGVLHTREWPYTKMQGFPFLYVQLSFINDDPYGISDV